MREARWINRDPSGAMRFNMRASSEGRAWNGLSASIFDSSGGYAEARARPYHSVIIQIGAPVGASCRCDGVVQRRRATPGDIDILPEAASASWQEDGPTTQLDIHVSPALVSSAAESMALDPDKV